MANEIVNKFQYYNKLKVSVENNVVFQMICCYDLLNHMDVNKRELLLGK